MDWQVQDAKNRFSELIARACEEGPQLVTRHGRPVVRVIAIGASDADTAAPDDHFGEYLLAVPRVDGLPVPQRRSRKTPLVLGG